MHAPRTARAFPATITLILAALAVACGDAMPSAPEMQAPGAPDRSQAALILSEPIDEPAPPVPVLAPCLGLDEPLRISGRWVGWLRGTVSPSGHVHLTEHIDWSDVTVVSPSGLTWLPGPGAHESFSINQPGGSGAAVAVMHSLNARFLSQDGLANLQVWHRVHLVITPDGQPRVEVFILPFEARCAGSAR